jgi:hypothetical protein
VNDQETKVLSAFRERLSRSDFKSDMKITYRLTGGAPGQRLKEEVEIAADGPARVSVHDEMRMKPSEQASSTIKPNEVQELYQMLEQGLDSLTPASEARFVPDSLVGSIILEVGNKTATFYFLADESERAALGATLSAPISRAIQRFDQMEKRLLELSGG